MESQQTGWEAPAQEPAYTPPSQPKKSKAPLIIGLAIVLVIVVLAVAVLIVFLPFLGGKPEAPALMPADTEIFASIKADLGDLAGFRHLADVYGDVSEVEEALDDLQDDLDDQFGITWEDDIQPWLGSEVAVAVSGLQDVIEDYEDPIIVVMAQTRSKSASSEFIEKVVEYLEDEDWSADEDSYEGVDYYILEPEYDYGPYLYLGTVKNFVVFATDEDAMEDVVDASKGRIDSLEDNERFNDVMSVLPTDAVAYAIVDLEEVVADAMDTVEEDLEYYEGISLPREITDLYEAFGAYGMALGLHDDGLQLDVVMSFDPDSLESGFYGSYQVGASRNRILDWIPEDTLGFYSGQDLAQVWRAGYELLMEVPDADEQVEDLADDLGFRFDEELLSWASGEFAVAVVESGNFDWMPVGGFAVFEVDDERDAEALMEDLLDLMEEFGDLEIDTHTINDVEVTLVYDPWEDEAVLGYGFDDGHLIIGLTEDGLMQAISDAGSVTRNDSFRAVQKRLPSKTSGYLFVNLEEIMNVVVDAMSDRERENYQESGEPLIEPIKAIGLAGEPMDMGKGISHTTLFVYIP